MKKTNETTTGEAKQARIRQSKAERSSFTKWIRKGDLFLLAIFLVSIALILCIPKLKRAALAGSSDLTAGTVVLIRIAGEEYASLSLAEDQSVTIRTEYGTNVVVIEAGTVRMEESDCNNQICVNTGEISDSGGMIVCLPHRLSVEITAGTGEDAIFDAISY